MSNIPELDKGDYTFNNGASYVPKSDDARASVDAFLQVADDASLADTCIVDRLDERTTTTFVLTNVENYGRVELRINYGGDSNGYHAKVVLVADKQQKQVSVDGGIESAVRKIRSFLGNPIIDKKKTSRIMRRPYELDCEIAGEASGYYCQR